MYTPNSLQQETPNRLRKALLVLGIVLIAVNLRAPLTAVGPLVPTIKQSLTISSGLAGFLTTLPLLAFALLSLFAPRFADRYGTERTLLVSLALLTMGVWLRTWQSIAFLLLGTLLLGLAIAVCNVLLPSLIKQQFPQSTGMMTGVYTTMMNMWGAIGSGLSIPIAENWGWGWQGALGCWALLALLATVVWMPQAMEQSVVQKRQAKQQKRSIWRSSLAWQVTLFMGMQSLIFYVLVAWLPTILIEQGVDRASAGWIASINQFAALPVTLFSPILAQRSRNQRGFVVFSSVFLAIGFAGLLLSPNTWSAFWVAVIGINTGLMFSLSMMFFVLRTRNAQQAAQLSGMAQSVGYLLAAVGPTGFGYLHDFTESWTLGILFLIAITIALLFIGWGAASDRYISEENE